MGGINCGMSNGRRPYLTNYRISYANYTKHFFKGLEDFFKANRLVEEFTILEIENPSKALRLHAQVLEVLELSKNNFCTSIKYLQECHALLEPIFKYDKVREGSVQPYRDLNTSEVYQVLYESSLVSGDEDSWKKVVDSLQSNGELSYVDYQISELTNLVDIISKLKQEYALLKSHVQSGKSYVAIRDIDVKVTPYSIEAMTKINELSNSLSSLCLLEFLSHTSISGKEVTLNDFVTAKESEFLGVI